MGLTPSDSSRPKSCVLLLSARIAVLHAELRTCLKYQGRDHKYKLMTQPQRQPRNGNAVLHTFALKCWHSSLCL